MHDGEENDEKDVVYWGRVSEKRRERETGDDGKGNGREKRRVSTTGGKKRN